MQKVICPECKKEICNDVLFCPYCGYPFESKEIIKENINNINIQQKAFDQSHIEHDDIVKTCEIERIENTPVRRNSSKAKVKVKINPRLLCLFIVIVIITPIIICSMKVINPYISEVMSNHVTLETYDDEFVSVKYNSDWAIAEDKIKDRSKIKIFYSTDIEIGNNPSKLYSTNSVSLGIIHEEDINPGSQRMKDYGKSFDDNEKVKTIINYCLAGDKIGDFSVKREDNIVKLTGRGEKEPITIKAKYKYNPDTTKFNAVIIRYSDNASDSAKKDLDNFFDSAKLN